MQEPAAEQSVATSTDVCPVSGLALVCNFVSAQEEQVHDMSLLGTSRKVMQKRCHCNVKSLDTVYKWPAQALLKCAEEGEWETLARRRVCHFGYKFEYEASSPHPFST